MWIQFIWIILRTPSLAEIARVQKAISIPVLVWWLLVYQCVWSCVLLQLLRDLTSLQGIPGLHSQSELRKTVLRQLGVQ